VLCEPKKRIVLCPNPSCGKGEFIRDSAWDYFDRAEDCKVCGALIFIPANQEKKVAMYTVQRGDDPPQPIYKYKKEAVTTVV
jgi:hypothetical protein